MMVFIDGVQSTFHIFSNFYYTAVAVANTTVVGMAFITVYTVLWAVYKRVR